MQDNSGGLDAETFSYGSGRSGGRVRAGRPPDGPKRPRARRIGYDDRTGTGTRRRDNPSTRRDNPSTRRDDLGTRGDDIGARGDDIGTCNHGTRSHGAGNDPERPTDEEKDDGEDNAAAGNR
jgi:hypothetical protein